MPSITSVLLADLDEGAKVLVVDDSRAQRHLMATTLKRAGYQVIAADSAETAIELCSDPELRLIVSDWGMPGMDGPEFCRRLREMDRPYTYFILITSKADRTEKALGLDAGADDFITRPINWQELRSRIRAGERILEMQEQLREQNRIVAATLSELQEINAAVERDLAEARKLQMSLMPPPLAGLSTATIATKLVTCGQVGGDLVGYFPISERRYGLYSIDVSGHGIASALMTGRLSGLFSTAEPHRNVAFSKQADGSMGIDPPEAVVSRLNELMLDDLDTDIYFTCTLAYIDLDTGELDLCQAGHPHPLLLSQGQLQTLGDGGPPVGLISGLSFDLTQAQLSPGDRLFLFSDGCSECTNRADDMLTETGVANIVARAAQTKFGHILDTVEAGLRSFANGREFEDDVSMIALEYQP